MAAAEHIRTESGGNVSTWTVPGAGHIQGISVAPQAWEREVVSFLQHALEV